MPRRQALSALVFLGFAVLYAVFIARTTFVYKGILVGTLFDDALISLRYAFNFVSGHGLVWNPGESPPIEGYTNPLWTFVFSLIFLVAPFTKAPIAAGALGAVILLTSGWLAGRIVARSGGMPMASLAASILVLACYPYVFWTLRGMEVGLVGLLTLAAVALALETQKPSDRTLSFISLIAGLAFLTRPDAVLLFAPIFLALLWPLRPSVAWLPAILPAAICIAGQFLFRWFYYGELVPNTYTLKISGIPLGERLLHGLGALASGAPSPVVAAACVLLGLLAGGLTPLQRRLGLIGLGAAAIQSFYLVWVGGDAWAFDNSNRFLATVLPLLLVAAVACLPAVRMPRAGLVFAAALLVIGAALVLGGNFPLGPRSNWWALPGLLLLCLWATTTLAPRSLVAVLGLLLIVAAPGWTRWALINAAAVADDIVYARTGLKFRDTLPKGTTIAAAWLGAPSYYSGFNTIDILGKTDKVIARLPPSGPFRPGHNKMDLGHSVGELKPDVVMLHNAGVDVPAVDQPPLGPMGYTYLGNGLGLWFRTAYLESLRGKLDEPALRCLSVTPPADCR